MVLEEQSNKLSQSRRGGRGQGARGLPIYLYSGNDTSPMYLAWTLSNLSSRASASNSMCSSIREKLDQQRQQLGMFNA